MGLSSGLLLSGLLTKFLYYICNILICMYVYIYIYIYIYTHIYEHKITRTYVIWEYIHNFACAYKNFLLFTNKIQRDATVYRRLFAAKLLYIFRVSIGPIIKCTSNCNCSFWYRS